MSVSDLRRRGCPEFDDFTGGGLRSGCSHDVRPDSCSVCSAQSLPWGNPVLETLEAPRPANPGVSGWNIITTNNLDELQDLLEAIEDVGFEHQVLVLDARRYAVAWR
jgi:hypothetical protein